MATTAAQDLALGQKILRNFYDSAKSFYPFAVVYSFDELVKTLEARVGGKTFISGLGLAASLADFSDNDINSSMSALARNSGGKIPSKNGDFYAFMVDQGTKVSFTGAVSYTVAQSALDIVSGAQQVGESVLATGKILNFLLPIAVVYFGFLFLKNKTK